MFKKKPVNNTADTSILERINAFSSVIGVVFRDINIAREALTHRSYLNENLAWGVPHNERLEFLGDAVLELVVTDALFRQFPDQEEGRLTGIRSALVNYQILARVARTVGIEEYIWMSKGEAQDTGRARETLLANAFEALVGALYLDQGYSVAQDFIHRHVLSHVNEVVERGLDKDAKSTFQELAQDKYKVTPHYTIVEENGPEHNKQFKVGVFIGEKCVATGEGFSKQEAEIAAAHNGMYVFNTPGD